MCKRNDTELFKEPVRTIEHNTYLLMQSQELYVSAFN